MKREITLPNGNSMIVTVDDRKSTEQALVMELDPYGFPIVSTHFSSVQGHREAVSNYYAEQLSDDAWTALNALERGRFMLA